MSWQQNEVCRLHEHYVATGMVHMCPFVYTVYVYHVVQSHC